MDLTAFAEAVGDAGPVTIAGASSRGGAVGGVPCVAAPAGIEWLQADEMTVSCGAGTPVSDLVATLATVGQTVALPPGGTVGGALAVGHSGVRRLGDGALRDVLLQARYVSAAGVVVQAGGPTVKNVSGFDLCRLLVGSRGTLGFIGSVILRTRPLPAVSQWHRAPADDGAAAQSVFRALYRPTSVLWDGQAVWVLLEGHADDVAEQAAASGLTGVAAPPTLPAGGRWSLPPSALPSLTAEAGEFVAELGVGVVHRATPQPPRAVEPAVAALHARIKHEFDPTGRLNPGVDVLHV